RDVRVDRAAEQPAQRAGGIGRSEAGQLAQRLHLRGGEEQWREEGALVHAAPFAAGAGFSGSWIPHNSASPRGSSTSSGRPLPSTVIPARPRTRSSGGKSGL